MWLNEAKKLLADLFRHHGDIDNAKVNHLEQVGVAYNILLSLISPLRKVELCENIRKEVIYQVIIRIYCKGLLVDVVSISDE